MIREHLEPVENISISILTRQGGDINLASRIGNLPGFVGRLYFWKKAIEFIVMNQDCYDVIWLHSPLLIDATKLKYIKIVIITIHSTYYGNYNALRTARARRMHGINISLLYYLFASKLENNFIRQLSKLENKISITAVSPSVANELRENGARAVICISNGVNIQKFKPAKDRNKLRKKLGFPQNDLLILSVGRTAKGKGLTKLISVFSLLEKRSKHTMLVIVGNGSVNEIREFVDRKRVRNVRFLGFVEHEKIADVYACADVYIMTSIYEGHPLTLLEALACGLPCIVPNIPILSSAIKDADSGIVINLTDEEMATQQILSYIQDRQKRLEHSSNARNHAIKNLDWTIIAQKYLKELERLAVCAIV